MVAFKDSTPPAADRVLVLSRVFDAPRELVFKVWSSPEHIAKWWGPSQFTLPHCSMDFRVGGAFKFCMRAPDGVDHWVQGTYLEIVAPERISFTWVRPEPQFASSQPIVVTITLEEEAGKKTKLTLHQALFESTKIRDEHNQGWSECLERLKAYVEHGA